MGFVEIDESIEKRGETGDILPQFREAAGRERSLKYGDRTI